MQAECLHIIVEENVLAQLEQPGVGMLVVEQRTHVEAQFLQHILVDDAVAVQQVGEEIVLLDGLQVLVEYFECP